MFTFYEYLRLGHATFANKGEATSITKNFFLSGREIISTHGLTRTRINLSSNHDVKDSLKNGQKLCDSEEITFT